MSEGTSISRKIWMSEIACFARMRALVCDVPSDRSTTSDTHTAARSFSFCDVDPVRDPITIHFLFLLCEFAALHLRSLHSKTRGLWFLFRDKFRRSHARSYKIL